VQMEELIKPQDRIKGNGAKKRITRRNFKK